MLHKYFSLACQGVSSEEGKNDFFSKTLCDANKNTNVVLSERLIMPYLMAMLMSVITITLV